MPKTEKPKGSKKTPKKRSDKSSDLIRQQKLRRLIADNVGNKGNKKRTIGELMIEAGYSKAYSESPDKLKKTLSWQELMEKDLPDDLLSRKHNELLNATGIGHMVFPVATTDEEITELLATVNCIPQKFQHGDTAIHVWYWARDNRAIKEALDMAYKLKAKYPKEVSPVTQVVVTDDQLERILNRPKDK